MHFQSISALMNALEKLKGIPRDDLERVSLSDSGDVYEGVIKRKSTNEVVGQYTTYYQGIQPGRGKVFSTSAHMMI